MWGNVDYAVKKRKRQKKKNPLIIAPLLDVCSFYACVTYL